MSAGDVVFYRQGERPDPATIARALQGPAVPAVAGKVRMRGLKLSSDEVQEVRVVADANVAASNAVATVSAAPPVQTAAAEPEPSGVALQVQFGYNSAEILPEMIAPLDAVADGIKMAGGSLRVVIEGHTDAHGASDYNVQLSRRRAAAVKQFLVARHGIPRGFPRGARPRQVRAADPRQSVRPGKPPRGVPRRRLRPIPSRDRDFRPVITGLSQQT